LGALEVRALATHGLFVGNAPEVLAVIALRQIFVTDTVPGFRVLEGPLRDKLSVTGTSGFVARAIDCLHRGGSLANASDH
jgi:ribose-phosphate pyrophosphokinase